MQRPDIFMQGTFWRQNFNAIQSQFSANLTVAAPDGAAFARLGGATEYGVIGAVTAIAGVVGGNVSLRLEGSNDGTNWHAISESAPTAATAIVAGTTILVLNELTDQVVDVGRFLNLRVRLILAGTDPGMTMTVAAQAFSVFRGSGRASVQTSTVTRTGTANNGAAFTRAQGSRFSSDQVVVTAFAGAGTATVVLQGSPDGGTTWVTMGSATFTGNGSFLLEWNGSNLLDQASYMTFRFRITNPAGVTGFTATCMHGIDDTDWLTAIQGSGGGGGGSVVDEALIRVVVTNVGAEAANTIAVSLQILKFDGSVLAEVRRLRLIVYDTTGAGAEDLATNATFTAVTTGTAVSALGTNDIVVDSSTGGAVVINVLDAAAETVFLCAVDPPAPKPFPEVVVAAQQATLTYV